MQTIISEHQNNPIPIAYFNEMSLYFGNLYFLNNDYQKAIEYYQNGMESSNLTIKAISQSNMASSMAQQYIQEGQNNQQRFLDIVQKFKSSIYMVEFEDNQRGSDLLTEKQYLQIKVVLSQRIDSITTPILPQDIKIINSLSHQIGINLGEFYLYNSDFNEAIQLAMNCASQKNVLHKNAVTLVYMASIQEFQNNFEMAEKLYQNCLELENQGYNKVFCLQMYSQFLRNQQRIFESNDILDQSLILQEYFSEWQQNLGKIITPDQNFKF